MSSVDFGFRSDIQKGSYNKANSIVFLYNQRDFVFQKSKYGKFSSHTFYINISNEFCYVCRFIIKSQSISLTKTLKKVYNLDFTS